MSSGLLDFHHHFHFMVDIVRKIRDKKGIVIAQKRSIGFDENYGFLGGLVVEFLDVFRIISANTNDFHNGKGNKGGLIFVVMAKGSRSGNPIRAAGSGNISL
jgi:hypothetical protein